MAVLIGTSYIGVHKSVWFLLELFIGHFAYSINISASYKHLVQGVQNVKQHHCKVLGLFPIVSFDWLKYVISSNFYLIR